MAVLVQQYPQVVVHEEEENSRRRMQYYPSPCSVKGFIGIVCRMCSMTLAAAASVFSFVAVKGFKDYQQHSYLFPHPALNDAIVRLAVLSVLALIAALTEALSLLLLSLAAWGWRRSDHCIECFITGVITLALLAGCTLVLLSCHAVPETTSEDKSFEEGWNSMLSAGVLGLFAVLAQVAVTCWVVMSWCCCKMSSPSLRAYSL